MENKFWLRIALNAPEMEIRIPKEENEMLRSNTVSMKKKRAIIEHAMNDVFDFGDNAEVEIFYDDMDVCVSMNDNNDEIEKENSKMENKNQMDIIGDHILNLTNKFNFTLANPDNYVTDDDWNECLHFFDEKLSEVLQLVGKLGYTVEFEERHCGNPYFWNEYVKFEIAHGETGVFKVFQCKSYFKKYYSGTVHVSAYADSVEDAKKIMVAQLNAMSTDCNFDIKEEG